MYLYLGKYPEKAKRFAGAMSLSISDEGYELEYIELTMDPGVLLDQKQSWLILEGLC